MQAVPRTPQPMVSWRRCVARLMIRNWRASQGLVDALVGIVSNWNQALDTAL